MKQTTEDDALVGLLSAVIQQAVDDYKIFERKGIVIKGEPADVAQVGRRRYSRCRDANYAINHVDGMISATEVYELLRFLKGTGLQLLCDLTGHKACRIRTSLGLNPKTI